jgi:hypothetical protein
MNKSLLTNIYNAIKSAVSGSTSEVHFIYLPDEALLKLVSVTYQVDNTSNESTFDSLNALKVYSLKVKINAPQSSQLENLSIYIQNKIQSLTSIDNKVKYVKLITEDLFFDNELKIYTEFVSFEIQYS